VTAACRTVRAQLAAWAAGVPSPKMDAHLAGCQGCRAESTAALVVERGLRSLAALSVVPPAALRRGVRAKILGTPSAPASLDRPRSSQSENRGGPSGTPRSGWWLPVGAAIAASLVFWFHSAALIAPPPIPIGPVAGAAPVGSGAETGITVPVRPSALSAGSAEGETIGLLAGTPAAPARSGQSQERGILPPHPPEPLGDEAGGRRERAADDSVFPAGVPQPPAMGNAHVASKTVTIRDATGSPSSDSPEQASAEGQAAASGHARVLVRHSLIHRGRNEAARVAVALSRAEHLRVSVYDLRGTPVRELFDAQAPGGNSEYSWDGTDAAGAFVGPGEYIVVVKGEAWIERARVGMTR